MKRLRFAPFTPVSRLSTGLLNSIKDNDSSLKCLTFSSRDLGFHGIKILAEALCGNFTLGSLDLSSNGIEARGCPYIALVLQNQSRMSGGIKDLILSDNDIRDEGLRSIANALESNRVLESLWIDNNCIGLNGLCFLADSLMKNYTLERLHLKHNSFQSLSPLIRCTFNKESLEAVADSNHTIKHVFLNCGYSYECAELESILKINRLGKTKARRIKLARHIEADMNRLLELDMDAKLLPFAFQMFGETGNLTTMFSAMRGLSTTALMFCESDTMDVDSLDVEHMNDC